MDNVRTSKLELAAIIGAGAVLGAGVVLGASGIYMYHKLNRTVKHEIGHLSTTIDTLVKELEELRNPTLTKNSSKTRRTKFKAPSLVSSFGATSSGDEEFFDLSDDEIGMQSYAMEASQDISMDKLCAKIDVLLKGSISDREEAYLTLKQHLNYFSNSAEYLWRLAKATHLRALNFGMDGDLDRKKDAAFEAKEFATQALALDNNHSEVHKWFAITLGSASDFLSLQERIKDGYTFKEHVQKAVILSPDDSTLHHMLGRWCYEVFMLPWWQRNVAATLIAAPPEATAEEARGHFIKAEDLHPEPWRENKLYIAKSYIGEGDYTNAIDWIDKAVEVAVSSDEDRLIQQELVTLQAKYEGYRL